MATVAEPARTSLAAQAPQQVAEGRKAKPVKWWAVLGACCITLFAYLVAAWIVSGNFKSTPTGPTPVPSWMRVAGYANETLNAVVALTLIWIFVVRQFRRERRLGFDGMLVLALGSIYWQDPLPNIFQVTYVTNTALHQWGSWANFLPGWVVPRGHLWAEPLIYAGFIYIAYLFLGIRLGCVVMRKAKGYWPQLGAFGLTAICAGTFFIVDLVLEFFWMRIGLYAYPRAIRWLSLNPGKYYQLPVYEVAIWAACWAGMTAMRYFRDDKGRSIAERGIDSVRGTPGQKNVLQTLAVIGAVNAIFLLYNIPNIGLGMIGDRVPTDIARRSYFNNMLCGPGTDRTCDTKSYPIPVKDSGYVDHDGKLIVPRE